MGKGAGGARVNAPKRRSAPKAPLELEPRWPLTRWRDASSPPRLHHTAAPTPQCSPPNRGRPAYFRAFSFIYMGRAAQQWAA